jgi:hypothetical protein
LLATILSRTLILPVVLYVYESWSLTLREERKLRVFVNRVLRRIFGWKRDRVTGGWRKLHEEELHDLYSSPSINRSQGGRGGQRMYRDWGRRGTCIAYW